MVRKLIMAAALAASAATAIAPTAVLARGYGGGHSYHGGGYGRGYGGYGYRGGYYRDDAGLAIGAGILGLAVGTAIASERGPAYGGYYEGPPPGYYAYPPIYYDRGYYGRGYYGY